MVTKTISLEGIFKNDNTNIFTQIAERKILIEMIKIVTVDRKLWTERHPGMIYQGMQIEKIMDDLNIKLNWFWKLFIYIFARGDNSEDN